MNVSVTSRPFTERDLGADANRGDDVCMFLFRLVSCAQKVSYDCNMYKATPYVCHLSAHNMRMDEKDRIRTVQDTFLISQCKTLYRDRLHDFWAPSCLSLTIGYVWKYWLRCLSVHFVESLLHQR